jgi:hypothetical protein
MDYDIFFKLEKISTTLKNKEKQVKEFDDKIAKILLNQKEANATIPIYRERYQLAVEKLRASYDLSKLLKEYSTDSDDGKRRLVRWIHKAQKYLGEPLTEFVDILPENPN